MSDQTSAASPPHARDRRPVLWTLLAIGAGAGLAAQGRINGELGVRLEHGMLAALVSFLVGCGCIALLLAVSRPARAGIARLVAVVRDGTMPWWYLTTGCIGAFVVASQGLAAGITGIALFTVGQVAGQTISGLVVDRFAFGGLARKPITVPRVVGALLALAAVGLALFGTGDVVGVWLVALPFAAGLLQALQQAMGGLVQRHSGSAIAQSAQNFVVGTILLAIIVGVQALTGATAQPLPLEPWLYIGGALGVAVMALVSVAVHHLGVLALGLATICGQVIASVVFDLVLPADHPVTAWSLVGAALTIAAVAISALRLPGQARAGRAPSPAGR